MSHSNVLGLVATLLIQSLTVSAQQNCYYGPGAGFRGPSELIPCNTTGEISPCCLQGDTCLSGNACYNYATGNTYQYGCTDINYDDEACPKKCGWDPAKSPWMSILYCSDVQDLSNTWSCLGPESCGCEWNSSYALQILPSRGCDAMGSEARVALYAPSTLLPYVSLPPTAGGKTAYYSTTTDSDGEFSVISTAIVGYTPDAFTQFTKYRDVPDDVVYINPGATASPSTLSPAFIYTDSTPPAASPAPTSSDASSSAAEIASSNMATTTAPSETAAASSPSDTTASSGLSSNAKIGVGVGVAGGVCFLAALGICCFLIVRRRKKKNATPQQQPPQYAQGPPMDSYQQPAGWAPYQSPAGIPYYVVPAQNPLQKDHTNSFSASPAYSPPHSPPPPPSELSTEQGRMASSQPGAGSPGMGSMTPSEIGAGRND